MMSMSVKVGSLERWKVLPLLAASVCTAPNVRLSIELATFWAKHGRSTPWSGQSPLQPNNL